MCVKEVAGHPGKPKVLVSASSAVGKCVPWQILLHWLFTGIWKAPAITGLLADSQLPRGPDKPGPIE